MSSIQAKQSRVPRRTPRACQQCRAAKARCSGVHPCVRCARRSGDCFFPEDDPKVSVSEKYLRQLEQQAAMAVAGTAIASPPATAPPRHPSAASDDGEEPQEAYSTYQVGWESSPTWTRSEASRPPDTNVGDKEDNYAGRQLAYSSGSTRANNTANSREQHTIFARNPLVGDSTYLRDPAGRYRFMGPTSTWSFFRRLVALAEQSLTRTPDTPPDPFNTDGTALRLKWAPLRADEMPDVERLPPIDYSLYLFHTVKFHLGNFFQVIDEPAFLSRLSRFETGPQEVARTHRLWFAEYLLVLAFGESFLTNPGPDGAPSGCAFASRAMALIPDFAELHDEMLLSIEVLSLAALYFHSIDMRVSAFQYIGQALRLCVVEGIHRELPRDAFSEQLSRRCRTLWWTVYVLDRRLSAQMGAPSSIRDEDITAALPWRGDDSTMAITLTLSIKLSRLIAAMAESVYGVNDKLGTSFVKNTKSIIKRLAEVAQEGERIMSSRSQNAAPSRMTSGITLMHHSCILQATRPLAMCLMKAFLRPPLGIDREMISQPIASLLKTSVASALTTLRILCSLEKQRLLESFLPFHLEYAFSSALLLCIMQVVLPEYVADRAWRAMADSLFVTMTGQGSVIAGLRKSELCYLEQLLAPVLFCGPGMDEEDTAFTGIDASRPSPLAQGYPGAARNAWDAMFYAENMNPDAGQLFDLAFQFGAHPETDIIGRL